MRRAAVLLLATALIGTLPSPALADPRCETFPEPKLSLSGTATVDTRRPGTVHLGGELKRGICGLPGVPVTLFERTRPGPWTRVATVTTSEYRSSGTFYFGRRPTTSTDYLVVSTATAGAPSQRSQIWHVWVQTPPPATSCSWLGLSSHPPASSFSAFEELEVTLDAPTQQIQPRGRATGLVRVTNVSGRGLVFAVRYGPFPSLENQRNGEAVGHFGTSRAGRYALERGASVSWPVDYITRICQTSWLGAHVHPDRFTPTARLALTLGDEIRTLLLRAPSTVTVGQP